MKAVWNGITDDPDTGTYDQFNDACEVAHTMGGKGQDTKHPSPNTDDGNSLVREYLFPDGSIEYVIVNGNGIGVGTSQNLP